MQLPASRNRRANPKPPTRHLPRSRIRRRRRLRLRPRRRSFHPPAPDIAADPKPAENRPVTVMRERPQTNEPRKPAPVTKRSEREAPARARSAALPSAAASGVGRGRSDADTNYRGLVAAHLARHKQFPADARGRGEQGSALVMFSLDGGGAVSSVRLMRGSGVASIDAETQAMVRRASPFPAPPSGRPMTFTVPVRFYLQ